MSPVSPRYFQGDHFLGRFLQLVEHLPRFEV